MSTQLSALLAPYVMYERLERQGQRRRVRTLRSA